MRMIKLTFTGFGGFSVAVDAKAVTNFPTNRVRALLAYLLLEADRVHSRHALCGLFWPEYAQRDALRNLRDALYRLRQTLDHAQSNLSAELLTVTRQDVQFHMANVDVDVLRFEALLTHRSELAPLEEAVTLYQGELLAGFSLDDAPDFEEWLLGRREYLHMRVLAALQTLTQAYEAQEEYAEAQRFAQQSLTLDPYREATYQTLMRLAVRLGSPEQAVLYYNRVRKMLRDELGVEPTAETEELIGQIRRGSLDQGTLTHAVVGDDAPPPRPAVENKQGRETPARRAPVLRGIPHLEAFLGRQAELSQLEQWLVHDRCRLVAILGIGGIGKTSLAAQCVWALAGKSTGQQGATAPLEPAPFDHIFWRSLVNAPPLGELLPPLFQVLSNQQLVDMPESLDEQLRLLMGYLYDKRVLLVLDNLESILEPEQAGVYRSGYEPYGQLIEQVATYEHQSQVLLTSRERPKTFSRLERDSSRVKTLRLAGLDSQAGSELLTLRGLYEEDVEKAMLIVRYSGNPLALKLVADTVSELFGGDLSLFLTDNSFIFDDIRTVLDQHFARLSNIEQQILFWLAVEREPISLERLHFNLLQPLSQRQLIETVHNLQRRSLIELINERNMTSFGLQNVVTEYLTDRLVAVICQEMISGQMEHLHHHALLNAQANEHVRKSQVRLLLTPIATLLMDRLGYAGLAGRVNRLLAELRAQATPVSSYAGGNILNLLLHLKMDISGYCFAGICVWRGYFQGAIVTNVDFTEANLADSVFTDTFHAVHTLAVSPNGQFVAAGTTNGEIRLWRSTEGQLNNIVADQVIVGHTQQIWSVAFDPTGSLLASCSADQTIRLWDIASGRLYRTLEGHRGFVRSLAFSRDGALLASGGDDKTIQVWDVRSGVKYRTLTGHEGWVSAVHFHPKESILVSGSQDHTVRLWDVQNGESYRTLIGHTDVVWSVAFSPDGTVVASGSEDRSVRLWDTYTGHTQNVMMGHIGSIRTIAFAPDGKTLASASADHTIRVWNLQTGQVIHLLSGHTQWAFCLAFSPDGRTLVSSGDDQKILLWEFRGSPTVGMVRQMLQGCANHAGVIGFSPQDDMFAYAGIEHTVHLRKAGTGEILHTLQAHTSSIQTVAFDASGALLATGSADKSICLWDVRTGKVLHKLLGHSHWVLSVAFSPNHDLLASGSADHTVRLWNVRTGQMLHIFHDHTSWVWSAAFSADGASIASASEDQTIRIRDTQSGETRHILSGHDGWVLSVAYHPRGNLVASGSADRTVRLWDAQTGEVQHILREHTGDIGSLIFSPDGSLLASAGAERNICLWDAQTGRLQRILQNPTAVVSGIAFDRTGQLLASTGGDEIIRLWRVSTGECMHSWRNPGPYEGMNITGVTGISEMQREALKALGAVENEK